MAGGTGLAILALAVTAAHFIVVLVYLFAGHRPSGSTRPSM
jgi:hypothetical protein